MAPRRAARDVRRVAVTGMGTISPLGNDTRALFAALAAGRPGIARLAGKFHERLASPIGAAVTFDAASYFPAPQLRMLDRVSQFALAAALFMARSTLYGFTRSEFSPYRV